MEMADPVGEGRGYEEPPQVAEGHELVLGPAELQEEIDSLRRVVEAYANYPEAAEATIRRWEQSLQWLPKAHKEMLKHLPEKYEEARRCVASNAMFISTMLQAFDPPFPLPPDTPHLDTHHHAHHHDAASPYPSHAPTGQRDSGAGSGPDSAVYGHEHQGTAPAFEPHDAAGPGQGIDGGGSGRAVRPGLGPAAEGDSNGGAEQYGGGTGAQADGSGGAGLPGANLGSRGESSGGAGMYRLRIAASVVTPPPWLRIDRKRVVPPADADKVRCMLRSIVREWTAEGAQERREAFDPILNELRRKFKHRLFPVDTSPTSQPDENPTLANGQAGKASAPDATLEHAEPGEGAGAPPTSRGLVQGPGQKEAGEASGMPPTCYGPPRVGGQNEAGEGVGPGQQGAGEAMGSLPTCLRPAAGPPTCLVPGAGLGRLALEICRLGFSCQGNEFSFYTLICSSFLLNCCANPCQWALYPWVLSSCNSLSDADQLRAVGVPDDLPSIPLAEDGATPLVEFSMCGGEFVEVYRHPSQTGEWDSVATCFFIDTAHNIVEYLEVIWQVLRPGGVWVNLGPLLYHFAESAGPMLYPGAANEEEARKRAEMSLEISLEDVKRVAFSIGFELEKEEFVETTYSANPMSMMKTQYTCVLWTMIRPNN